MRTPGRLQGDAFLLGPTIPSASLWIDLSKPHYGIHGTPEPSKIGHVESHGCVRLTNWDAQRASAVGRPGIRVIFKMRRFP